MKPIFNPIPLQPHPPPPTHTHAHSGPHRHPHPHPLPRLPAGLIMADSIYIRCYVVFDKFLNTTDFAGWNAAYGRFYNIPGSTRVSLSLLLFLHHCTCLPTRPACLPTRPAYTTCLHDPPACLRGHPARCVCAALAACVCAWPSCAIAREGVFRPGRVCGRLHKVQVRAVLCPGPASASCGRRSCTEHSQRYAPNVRSSTLSNPPPPPRLDLDPGRPLHPGCGWPGQPRLVCVCTEFTLQADELINGDGPSVRGQMMACPNGCFRLPYCAWASGYLGGEYADRGAHGRHPYGVGHGWTSHPGHAVCLRACVRVRVCTRACACV